MKRRAAIEPGIGHLKHGHRMDRNRLKGAEGDMFNAILSATGMNMSKLVKRLVDLLRLVYIWVYKRIFRILSLNLKLDQVNSLTYRHHLNLIVYQDGNHRNITISHWIS